MIRRLAGLGAASAAAWAAVPVALADGGKPAGKQAQRELKPVYGEPDVPQNLPGTVLPAAPKPTVLRDAENRVEEALQVERLNVGGATFSFATALEGTVGRVRRQLETWAAESRGLARQAQDRLVTGERSAATTIAELRAPGEEALPNAIYILVAGLTGSIVARPRNVLVRLTLPWIFGVGAFAALMPRTFENARAAIVRAEREHVPELAQAQSQAQAQLVGLGDQTRAAVAKGEKEVRGQVRGLRETLREYTGLGK